MVFPREVFLGFSRYYNSLNIIYSESLSTHTGRLISYFDELGRMLGYRIKCEKTMGNLVSPCPKNLEKKKVDMVWDWEKGKSRTYEVAVESQQSPSINRIRLDINKLVNLPAKLKVLYCAAGDHNKILKLIGKMRLKFEDDHGKFLTIIDPWAGNCGFSEGTLKGILLDRKGEIIGEGTAKVSEIVDGTDYIRVFLDAKWKYM